MSAKAHSIQVKQLWQTNSSEDFALRPAFISLFLLVSFAEVFYGLAAQNVVC